jgi:transcription elongation factor Elf1
MTKITRDYQEGVCNICNEETLVRVVVNNKKAVSVCKDCINKVGNMTVNELLNKFGHDIDLNAS